jgi:hypothetical protein
VISVWEAVRLLYPERKMASVLHRHPLNLSISLKLYGYCKDTPKQYNFFTFKLNQRLSIFHSVIGVEKKPLEAKKNIPST